MKTHWHRKALVSLALIVLATLVWSCSQRVIESSAPPTPPPTYSGPEFFRGAIMSVSTVRGYEPILVQGYGLVVNLKDTGSPDVPPMLREWLVNELSRGGFGKESLGFGHLTPDQVLNSRRTAVVLVEAILPPGATKGTRFDCAVAAVPGTQTTSLEGGLLYTTDLRFRGAYPGVSQSRPFAQARGPVFLNPFVDVDTDADPTEARPDNPRVGQVLAGAAALQDMPMALVLNQPSYARSRQIADRINGRFPRDPKDKFPLATAATDGMIRLEITREFRDEPRHILDLVGHLYLNPTDAYAREKAAELRAALENPANAQWADRIALAWEGMGRRVLPLLRQMYDHEKMIVRVAALEAGAALGDLQATDPLTNIARQAEPGSGEKATAALGELLKQHPGNFRVRAMLRELLDSDDVVVRLEALFSLAKQDDPVVVRREFTDGRNLVFELVLARSEKPMIYVSRSDVPRIVVFGQNLGFEYPLFLSLWDSSLMLRGDEGEPTIAVYHRPEGALNGKTEQCGPTVGNLIFLLANRSMLGEPAPGCGMSYSQVVRVLYELTRLQMVDAPLVLEPSDLMQRVAAQKSREQMQERPETDVENESGMIQLPNDVPGRPER